MNKPLKVKYNPINIKLVQNKAEKNENRENK